MLPNADLGKFDILENEVSHIPKKCGVLLLLEIEKVKKGIQQLSEAEAKALLLITYGRLDTAINGNGGDEFIQQTVRGLYDFYSKISGNEELKDNNSL